MKESGFTHWNSPNSGATNESGFNALPAGDYWNGGYSFFGLNAEFWTSNAADINLGWERVLRNSDTNTQRNGNYKTMAISVRCIKN